MEIGDVVEAQLLTNFQLKLIRDKVVVERMRLVEAVLSLYPNFNVSDSANMQQLNTQLQTAYPELKNAIQVATLTSVINSRSSQIEKIRDDNNLPETVLRIEIDWKGVPVNVRNFKTKAQNILNYLIETERLKSERAVKDSTVPK